MFAYCAMIFFLSFHYTFKLFAVIARSFKAILICGFPLRCLDKSVVL